MKTLEKRFGKFIFVLQYNSLQKHKGFVGFENACSRAKTYVILMSLNYFHFYACYCWWCQFLWWPRMHICKVQKPCINSTWIAWLIDGFLLVKTWLLIIVCNRAFNAIILINIFSIYPNNFCDAGQVPILKYFKVCGTYIQIKILSCINSLFLSILRWYTTEVATSKEIVNVYAHGQLSKWSINLILCLSLHDSFPLLSVSNEGSGFWLHARVSSSEP